MSDQSPSSTPHADYEPDEFPRPMDTALLSRRLQGRVAIVTGGGHGIGRVYAQRLATEGAHVVIGELDGDAGEETAKALRGIDLACSAVQTDITQVASLDNLVREASTVTGQTDILVNNAAMFATVPMSRAPFDGIEPEEWDRMMMVNLKGTWLACRSVAPVMRRAGYGKIVNISSGTAFKGAGTRIHYVTSKAGVLGFTKSLARELGPSGIRVNCVAPGNTLSEVAPDAETLDMRRAGANDRALARLQRPDDIVGAVAFFSAPDSDFITGQTLVVDGGSYMH